MNMWFFWRWGCHPGFWKPHLCFSRSSCFRVIESLIFNHIIMFLATCPKKNPAIPYVPCLNPLICDRFIMFVMKFRWFHGFIQMSHG
jgi:hypothetical protein